MARILKKKKEEIGTSPDQLIFRGEHKVDQVEMSLIDYGQPKIEEKDIHNIEEVLPFVDKASVTWLNVNGLHDIGLMESIARAFNLELLMLADVMNTIARPTVTEYDSGFFISIKMLRQDPHTDTIHSENLSLILHKTLLISFQELKGDVFEPVRERIRKYKKRISGSGTDYLAFALLDVIIDNYIVILSTLGEKIEDLEDELVNNPNAKVIHKIEVYKRELNFLRRNIRPAKEMIVNLLKEESDLIQESSEVHFHELENNINHATELSDSYREILSDQLNIYHTMVSSRLNDVMKVLTIFSVIFIPLTFIAGIYGTNFSFIPELGYKYSYFVMLGVMVIITIGMLFFFKHKKWL